MNDAPISASAERQLATRLSSVYRMHPAESLRELVALKVLEDPEERFEFRDVDVGELPALLVSGESDETPVEWTSAVNSLTGVDLGFTSTTASAALFMSVDDVNYALTFGQGWRYLREVKIDRQFGLDVGARLLDPDEIRQITRWALSAKARVDRNMVPGGQGLWAFGLREHAELVRNLAGKAHDGIEVKLTYARRRGQRKDFRLSIECGDGLHIQLGVEGESLVADLRELTRLVESTPINQRLEPLRWVRRLNKGHERCEQLDTTAVELLLHPDDARGQVGIAYPARYYDGPTVHRYVGTIGDTNIDTDELTLDQLRSGLNRYDREEYLRVLGASRIDGLDENKQSLGGDVSALHWMAAEIAEPDARFVLVDGDWFQLGDEYLKHVSRIVDEAFTNTPAWTLPPWTDAPRNKRGTIVEKAYNQHVARIDDQFLCLDTRLVYTRAHPQGFEACDLLGPGNVLVHVKRVSSETGSSALSHLFAQGLVAIESLTDTATWKDFVTLVAKHDPARAASLGDRPAGLVYAIHRSDKPLQPSTLFTFARSALVSASVALTTYGVPLMIYVIP
ncbi:DUF6119 family protein [Amycolatopsis japonica]|uniref:DUF6119 family protein n=1 Tax=Amycolatopsis japonica TaxID=208439 RepID=UPI0033FD33B9